MEIGKWNNDVLRGENWNKFYNPLISGVVVDYCRNGGILFAITGDLDNLGIYVARNGRPNAENLVDLYNQVSRNFFQQWILENKAKISPLALIPSGEEIFCIGIGESKNEIDDFFSKIKDGVMQAMTSQSFIEIGETSISFGAKILKDDLIDKLAFSFSSSLVNNEQDDLIFRNYLEFMIEVRSQTAVALDAEKFKNILGGEHPIQMRQLVLTRMLLYKKATKMILESLDQLPKEDATILLAMLGHSYGIEYGDEDKVDTFLKNAKK